MTYPRIIRIVCVAMLATFMHGCFTGIESTPRISSNEVKKHSASAPTSEQSFLSGIKPIRPKDWQPGKRFYVTDDKISIIFLNEDVNCDSLNSLDLIFAGFEEVPSLTGEGAVLVKFDTSDNRGILKYRVNIPLAELMKRDKLEIPFTVERSTVESVNKALLGNTYYITTPKWFGATDNKAVTGKRHIPVTVSKVEPGTFIYPLRVYFTYGGNNYWIPMTLGDERTSTRNFSTVFNFEDPRKRYPQIGDKTWSLITESKVAAGMTRDECRLALGAPNSYRTIPVFNALVEQWNYDDGLYLIFEDGILTRFRI